MRPKNLVMVVFVVSLLVGGYALLNAMRKSDASVPSRHILVATAALPAGTLLRSQDIEWRPANETQPDQIVRPSASAVEAKPDILAETEARVYGAVLRHHLAVGEPIRRGDIVKPGERDFLKVVLPQGARAIAIPLTTGGASTGLLSPGDRVDVVLTQNFKHDGNPDTRNTPITRRSVSETVVQNLRVLAIDAVDPKSFAGNGGFGRTVTLEVTPDQVEKINVATELGKLSVALRSTQTATDTPAETVKPQWAGDVSPALYGAAQERPTAMAPHPIQVFRGNRERTVTPEN
jgi:pilus assembly protein CpaB